MSHPALTAQSVAVITGGAQGIGLALAKKLASSAMHIHIVDMADDLMDQATATIKTNGAASVTAHNIDVADRAALNALEAKIAQSHGGTDILINNAGIQPGSDMFASENWNRVLDVNMGGVINGSQIFPPRMIERGRPGMIINTGSKQGITTPPGDPAYNTAKAAVKAFTEALAYELRNTQGANLTAHLLIPGFVFTNINSRGRTEKPDGAWTPEQTAEFAIDSINRGDFYILCPDNDVQRATDEKRMAWAIGDIIENRPALSRWHPDFEDAFKEFVNKP